jgi:hypothetical protein
MKIATPRHTPYQRLRNVAGPVLEAAAELGVECYCGDDLEDDGRLRINFGGPIKVVDLTPVREYERGGKVLDSFDGEGQEGFSIDGKTKVHVFVPRDANDHVAVVVLEHPKQPVPVAFVIQRKPDNST